MLVYATRLKLWLCNYAIVRFTSCLISYFQPQEELEGYNYEVPENPLVISRPQEPVEAASDARPDAQEDAGESHGGGGHGHHGGSGDPLDWLRESIPGKGFIAHYLMRFEPN